MGHAHRGAHIEVAQDVGIVKPGNEERHIGALRRSQVDLPASDGPADRIGHGFVRLR
jgi:hypothetical protein